MTIAAKRLAKKNVLVKDLQGVETLGAITMLATDKTGTLTQNKMTVVGCWIGKMPYQIIDWQDSAKNSDKILQLQTPNCKILVESCCLCSKYLEFIFLL